MKYFPAICIDNFYNNPDEVRDFALKQKFEKSPEGNFPGKRTKQLHLINKKLFDIFCNKFFSIFYDFNKNKINWTVSTSFQLIKPFDKDPKSPKNQGWIHLDHQRNIGAGIIYLTPDAHLDSGTSIFRLIKNKENDLVNEPIKQNFFLNKKVTNYNKKIMQHNNCFEETIKFNNCYNRLIAFDSECHHKANNFFTNTKPRLTQVFFITEMKGDSEPPIIRNNKYNN
jgi:hypothetical protein